MLPLELYELRAENAELKRELGKALYRIRTQSVLMTTLSKINHKYHGQICSDDRKLKKMKRIMAENKALAETNRDLASQLAEYREIH